jgi:hypothetical protein
MPNHCKQAFFIFHIIVLKSPLAGNDLCQMLFKLWKLLQPLQVELLQLLQLEMLQLKLLQLSKLFQQLKLFLTLCCCSSCNLHLKITNKGRVLNANFDINVFLCFFFCNLLFSFKKLIKFLFYLAFSTW